MYDNSPNGSDIYTASPHDIQVGLSYSSTLAMVHLEQPCPGESETFQNHKWWSLSAVPYSCWKEVVLNILTIKLWQRESSTLTSSCKDCTWFIKLISEVSKLAVGEIVTERRYSNVYRKVLFSPFAPPRFTVAPMSNL